MGFVLFLLILAAVCILAALSVFFASRMFPNFFKFTLRRILNGAICVLGFLTPLALATIWATTHDIFNDYVSAPLFSKFKTDLPGWYVENVHSCHGEWNALGIGFLVILLFHVLLLARFLVSWATNQNAEQLP